MTQTDFPRPAPAECTSGFDLPHKPGRLRMLKVQKILADDPSQIGPFCDVCYDELRWELKANRAEGRFA